MNVKFIEPALIEMDDAIKYYNEQLEGLGNRFYIEVIATVGLIQRFSDSWNKCSLHTRKAILKIFPYNLFMR